MQNRWCHFIVYVVCREFATWVSTFCSKIINGFLFSLSTTSFAGVCCSWRFFFGITSEKEILLFIEKLLVFIIRREGEWSLARPHEVLMDFRWSSKRSLHASMPFRNKRKVQFSFQSIHRVRVMSYRGRADVAVVTHNESFYLPFYEVNCFQFVVSWFVCCRPAFHLIITSFSSCRVHKSLNSISIKLLDSSHRQQQLAVQ